MDDKAIAWFAGLFEGEGCLELPKNGGVRLTIRMTDRDIIERVNDIFPCTNISSVNPKPVRPEYNQPKTQYCWRISNPERVREIINLMLPWLGQRRGAKAREILAHLDSRPGTGGHMRAKTHCAQGHPYTKENTAYGREGNATYRRCRTCMKQWWTDGNTKRYRAREAQAMSAECKICGKAFEYLLGGASGARRRTLCSDECRAQSRRRSSREFAERRRSAGLPG